MSEHSRVRTKAGHIRLPQGMGMSTVVSDGEHGSLQVKNLTAAYSKKRRLDTCAHGVLTL